MTTNNKNLEGVVAAFLGTLAIFEEEDVEAACFRLEHGGSDFGVFVVRNTDTIEAVKSIISYFLKVSMDKEMREN
jgi:hypothetical protein